MSAADATPAAGGATGDGVAYLGVGLLGAALAEAAAGRGEHVTVWNRTAAKARALDGRHGIRAAETPADAVRAARFVHLVLRDDAAVEEVLASARPALAADAMVLDHSTTAPAATAERAARLAAEGVRYLHCPVFIGPAAARAGKGVVLASGPTSLFDAARAHLAAMAPRLEWLGERPEAAAVHKLAGNALIIGLSAVVADVYAVAAGGGVPPADAFAVFGLLDPAAMIAGRGRSMADGRFAAQFELAMARKDVALMLETAGDRALAALPAVAARMDALIAEGHGADDLAVLGRDARA